MFMMSLSGESYIARCGGLSLVRCAPPPEMWFFLEGGNCEKNRDYDVARSKNSLLLARPSQKVLGFGLTPCVHAKHDTHEQEQNENMSSRMEPRSTSKGAPSTSKAAPSSAAAINGLVDMMLDRPEHDDGRTQPRTAKSSLKSPLNARAGSNGKRPEKRGRNRDDVDGDGAPFCCPVDVGEDQAPVEKLEHHAVISHYQMALALTAGEETPGAVKERLATMAPRWFDSLAADAAGDTTGTFAWRDDSD